MQLNRREWVGKGGKPKTKTTRQKYVAKEMVETFFDYGGMENNLNVSQGQSINSEY